MKRARHSGLTSSWTFCWWEHGVSWWNRIQNSLASMHKSKPSVTFRICRCRASLRFQKLCFRKLSSQGCCHCHYPWSFKKKKMTRRHNLENVACFNTKTFDCQSKVSLLHDVQSHIEFHDYFLVSSVITSQYFSLFCLFSAHVLPLFLRVHSIAQLCIIYFEAVSGIKN